MCANQNEKRFAEILINSQLPEVAFNLNKSNELKPSIKRALLETIVSGIASKKSEIIEYTNCFIINSKEETNKIDSSESYLKWLESNKFIAIVNSRDKDDENTIVECYKATQLGHAVVASAMSPDDGLIIFSELSNALKCFVLDTELHCIYQITPINICEQWTSSSSRIDWNRYFTIYSNLSSDMKRVADLVGVRERFIVKMINGHSINNSNINDLKLLKIHGRFYTALILNDLVNEIPFASVLVKYDCHKGFLQSLQQQSSTYAQMIHIFCNKLGWFNLEILIEQFQTRLMFGVQRQLLDLVRIKLLDKNRARLFYSAGLTTVASIATSDLKKLEKILRSSQQFISANPTIDSNNKSNELVNSKGELVFWSDGKSYTYWEATEVIYSEANQILKNDLELLGVKIDIKADNKNNRTAYEFNDTYDSMIQSQKKLSIAPNNPKSNDDQEVKAIEASEEIKIIVNHEINNTLQQNNSPKDEEMIIEKTLNTTEDDLLNQISLTSVLSNKTTDNKKQLNEELIKNEINSLKDLIFETQISSNKASNSFIDDQCILEAAETFEKKSTTRKSLALNEIHNLNTTLVSQDILEMCDIFEKKSVLSSKKKIKENLNQTKNLDKSKFKNLFSEQTLNITDFNLNDLEKQINLINIQLNLIQYENEFEKFYSSIKPKSIISISLAIQKYEIKNHNDNDFFYSHLIDSENAFKFYGIFICFDNEKQKQIHFLVSKKDKKFQQYFKNIFEREDLNKILFFVKEHYKIINELFDIRIKMPCYDPCIADWILNQQITNIFQIKQKYSTSLTNNPIDFDLRTNKTCYGCNLNLKQHKDYVNIIRRASIECLIAAHTFDKIKLQLQLQNLWIYYAKVESEIVLLASQIECDGFGFSSAEFNNQKNMLINFKKEIEIRINKIIGRDINLNSTAEVAYVLYDQLKLKPSECNRNSLEKFKHHSTSKDTLLQLAKQHVLPQMIVLWRKINHTLSNSMYPVDQVNIFLIF